MKSSWSTTAQPIQPLVASRSSLLFFQTWCLVRGADLLSRLSARRWPVGSHIEGYGSRFSTTRSSQIPKDQEESLNVGFPKGLSDGD